MYIFQIVLYCVYLRKCEPDFSYFLGSNEQFSDYQIETTAYKNKETRGGRTVRKWTSHEHELSRRYWNNKYAG